VDLNDPRKGCLSSASLTDALGRLSTHRAHVLDLMSPTPGRVLRGRAVTIRFVPFRQDVFDDQVNSFASLFHEAVPTDPEEIVLVLDSGGQPDISVPHRGPSTGARLHQRANHRVRRRVKILPLTAVSDVRSRSATLRGPQNVRGVTAADTLSDAEAVVRNLQQQVARNDPATPDAPELVESEVSAVSDPIRSRATLPGAAFGTQSPSAPGEMSPASAAVGSLSSDTVAVEVMSPSPARRFAASNARSMARSVSDALEPSRPSVVMVPPFRVGRLISH
jgi:hypothetical protein